MVDVIRGTVVDVNAPNSPLGHVRVEYALDVGLELDKRAPDTRTSSVGFTHTDGLGLFRLTLTDDEVQTLLGRRRHREVLFRVYDSSETLLGTQTAYISAATLRGTETVLLSVDPNYTLNTRLRNFAVSGFVTDPDGTPRSGTDVRLLKKTLRNMTQIGSAISGTDGRFLIRYTGAAGEHSDRASFSIFLVASTLPATAGPFCNPPADLTVRLVTGDGAYRGRPGHDLDVATISPLLDTATLDELDVNDVKFLMCRTELNAATLATLARAHALALKYGIPAAVFTAFSHAGISLGTNSITGLDAQQISSAINRAVADNVVPESLTASIPAITAAVAAARVDRIVPAADPHTTTLGAILIAASLPSGTPRAFAEAFAAHVGTAEEFWTSLRAATNFGDTLVDKIQFALQASALSASHPPLVKLLENKRSAGVFTHAAELAQYEEQDWIDFFAESVDGNPVHTPVGMVGENDTRKRLNYATAITLMIADLYPSAHLAYRLPLSSVNSRANVINFVIQNPGFSFRSTLVKQYFTTASGLPALQADKDALLADLLKVQRVFVLSPRFGLTAVVQTLLDQGIASANQIQRMGFAAFKTKFSQSLDLATISAIHETASKVAAATTEAWLAMRAETYLPFVAAIPKPSCSDPALEELFGSLDYCACKPCESVLGPAAYFVDIMHFVQEREPQPAGEPPPNDTLLGSLLDKRPELQHVDLNCENAETSLPTIDLINEVLEARARVYLALGPVNYKRQTTWTADELLIHPEHLDRAVYGVNGLSSVTAAHFPLLLPFDLQLEEARAYLQSLGTSRVALQDALEWFGGLDETEAYRVDERLGLSNGQGRIIRNGLPAIPDLQRLWGFAQDDATWEMKINDVETFLVHTGLDFQGLKDLLQIKDLADYTEILYAVPCRLKDARFVRKSFPAYHGLTLTRLRMLQGFLRTQRALGWSTFELDATRRALNISFDDAGLRTLAGFVRLRSRFPQIPLGELLSWVAPIDDRVYNEEARSYYHQIVQPLTRDPAFKSLDGSVKLLAVRGELLGILRVDEASLAAIYAGTGLTEDTDDLTLENLSTLFRVASIARAVGFSPRDLVTLTKYTQTLNEDAGPFAGALSPALRELIDVAEDVRRSGFTVPALDWILRDKDPGSFGAGDLDVMDALIGAITALQKARVDHAGGIPSASLPWTERAASLLAQVHPEDKAVQATHFVLKNPPAPLLEAEAEALREELLPFLNEKEDKAEFLKLFPQAESAEARAERVVKALEPWLLARRLAAVLIQRMAIALSLPVADTDTLVRKFDVEDHVLGLFTSDAFIAAYDPAEDASKVKDVRFPREFLARAALQVPAAVYRNLRKVALVANTFRLGSGLLRWLLLQQPNGQPKLPDLAHLPAGNPADSVIYDAYKGWDWLRRAIRLRDEVFTAEPGALTLILDDTFNGSFNEGALLKRVADAAGWDVAVLTAFESSEPVTQAKFKTLEPFQAFATALHIAARLGVAPKTALEWAREPVVTAVTADAIRNAAQARFSGPTWASVAKPIRDRLRERQRDALAEYVFRKEGLTSREDLFGHRLLDVDMAPCNRTTRLLFATGAVQLFMQRAFMGLIEGITLSDEDADEWTWMKRYRVWEANRKIFLYPENWVQPELRDDKTPLFKRLEQELSQGQIDDEAVELAYIHYLEGLHEVGHLEVSGMYHETETANNRLTVDRMHVFARSSANPTKLFYRCCEDNAYWTAWEELPFRVEHKGVLPLIVNRRLMIVWPKVEQTQPKKPEEEFALRLKEKDPNKDQDGGGGGDVGDEGDDGDGGVDSNELPDGGPSVPGGRPSMPANLGLGDGTAGNSRIHLMWAELQESGWTGVRSVPLGTFPRWAHAPGTDVDNNNIHMNSRITAVDATVRLYLSERGESIKSYINCKYDSCLGKFLIVNLKDAESPADGEASLTEPVHAPLTLTSGFQGHWRSRPLTTGPNDNGTSPIRIPIRPSENAQLEFSDVIIYGDKKSGLSLNMTFPRQDLTLEGTLPLIYSDTTVSLYMRAYSWAGAELMGPDKVSLGPNPTHTSLQHYLGLADITVAPVKAPQNAKLALTLKGGDSPATMQQWTYFPKFTKYYVSVFYHPFTCRFLERVRKYGVVGLLDPLVATHDDNDEFLHQQATDVLNPYIPYFGGVKTVHKPIPMADIDFRYGGAYSAYNWELFFHLPMYIADRLMAERRFADAQRWLGYIFNPLRKPTHVGDSCTHYWNLKEFRENSENLSIDLLLETLQYDGPDGLLTSKKKQMIDQIDQMRKDPFRPHALARLRPTAYMRAVVMKYLDNLIAWGDDLFRQDTRESTQEAVQLYLLALQILGKRPRAIDDSDHDDMDYSEAKEGLDEFSNFLALENGMIGFGGKFVLPQLDGKAQANLQANHVDHFQIAYVKTGVTDLTASKPVMYSPSKPAPVVLGIPSGDVEDPAVPRLYFCIPPNDKLLRYWETVADRLFKLHNCLNIEGIRRDLALFDPPIDPALLAKAVSQGLDIGTAINSLYAPLPHYRFLPHLGIAKDFVAQVTALGSSLLQALEKRDAEALALLRSRHEVDLLKLVRSVKETAVKEADAAITALERGADVASLRETYYRTREFMNQLEEDEAALSWEAAMKELEAAEQMLTASKLALLPLFTLGTSGNGLHWTLSLGGNLLPQFAQIVGQRMSMEAAQKSREAARTAVQASYTRRQDEWTHQVDVAAADLIQINAQITAAQIRKRMAELDLANHDTQVEQSAEALEYMQSKFTNSELYVWMSGEISKVYHMSYQLALDLARRAERCYHYELADENVTDFIQIGHWDNLWKGLLAGERLAHDIRRMEAAYYQNNRREYELTKRISLAGHDPVALISLRKTGTCHFNLPALLFDLDHPSHYMRRIKLVGVSIPAVSGPYTNIGVTLSYESGELKKKPDDSAPTPVSGLLQTVAISVTQEDTGLFEPNLRDERYLPFEGRALDNSKWRLTLPEAVRQFDYETISDIILTIRYTSREGGSTTANKVNPTLVTRLASLGREEPVPPVIGQTQVFQARSEFPEAWRTFIANGETNLTTTLEFDLTEDRFPHRQVPPGNARTIDAIYFFARWAADSTIAPGTNPFEGAQVIAPVDVVPSPVPFGLYKAKAPLVGSKDNYLWIGTPVLGGSKGLGTWQLTVPGWSAPNKHAPAEMIIVVVHNVS